MDFTTSLHFLRNIRFQRLHRRLEGWPKGQPRAVPTDCRAKPPLLSSPGAFPGSLRNITLPLALGCIHSGIAVHSHKHLLALFWPTVTSGWLLQAQLLNHKTACMGHERMLRAWSESEEVVHLEVAFCQYQSKIPHVCISS